jgi:hypothetical protein
MTIFYQSLLVVEAPNQCSSCYSELGPLCTTLDGVFMDLLHRLKINDVFDLCFGLVGPNQDELDDFFFQTGTANDFLQISDGKVCLGKCMDMTPMQIVKTLRSLSPKERNFPEWDFSIVEHKTDGDTEIGSFNTLTKIV